MPITPVSRVLWCWPVLPPEDDIPAGIDVEPFSGTQDELREAVEDVDGLLVRRGYVVDAVILAKARKLRLIQRAGTNLSNIDAALAATRGIKVATMPMHIDISVAEHALALMLGLARRMVEGDHAVRTGAYRDLGLEPVTTDETLIATNWMAYESIPTLFGRTLGIVGYGEIGQLLATRAASLGMRVLCHRRSEPAREIPGPAVCVGLAELLREADFVSLHVPLTNETKGLVNLDFLTRMRRGAFLVNTSRGSIVDELALAQALRDGWLGGAGLDVFSTEPPPTDAPLLSAPNLLLSPHVASGTDLAKDMAGLIKGVAIGLDR